MKYRSITLNDNKKYQLSFIKYNDEYKYELEKLKKLNPTMADYVEGCPQIYSELSEEQSYMIICDGIGCIGAINIGTSFDEKTLEIKLHFDEKHFISQMAIISVIEQIVESLRLFFYDKENIEINLVNDIDLSKYNSAKYTKQIYDENLTTYTCSNWKNKILIPKLITEITETEKNLTDWNQSWQQKIKICNDDLDEEIDSKLIKEYQKETISLEELFYKAESLSWYDIKSNTSTRKICFSRNGQIDLKKASKSFNGLNYAIDYNLLYWGFTLTKYPSSNETDKRVLEVENGYNTKIKYGNLEILYNKSMEREKITYVTDIIDKSSIYVELWLNNNQEEINRCYVDFRTHKGNGKINGTYRLTIYPKFYGIILNYITRNGDLKMEYTQILPKELISSVYTEKLSYDLIGKIINETILLINKHITPRTQKPISEKFGSIIPNITDVETEVIDTIKQIKGEIPLPCLQEKLEKFINETEKEKNDSKKRTLKK